MGKRLLSKYFVTKDLDENSQVLEGICTYKRRSLYTGKVNSSLHFRSYFILNCLQVCLLKKPDNINFKLYFETI